MKSYDYAARKGVRQISWQDFSDLVANLVEQIEPCAPDAIVGIARAGLFPATAVACSLRRELFPVRLSRRINDEVRYEKPVWVVPVCFDVAGKTLALVDEIADSGQTLAMAASELRSRGAEKVLTACLVSHTWAEPPPDFSALCSDELIIFPWDRQVLVDGRWQPHPEVVAALQTQKKL